MKKHTVKKVYPNYTDFFCSEEHHDIWKGIAQTEAIRRKIIYETKFEVLGVYVCDREPTMYGQKTIVFIHYKGPNGMIHIKEEVYFSSLTNNPLRRVEIKEEDGVKTIVLTDIYYENSIDNRQKIIEQGVIITN